MTAALVTGATGFIGRHCLARLAARGYDVHAVSSREAPGPGTGCCWHRADLLDAAQVTALVAATRPTHLLHLAWCADPGTYRTSPENLRWLQASLGLLREFARQGGRRVVMAGTCAEYDWSHGFCSETLTPLAPVTLYGTCKHALQLALAAFAAETGLSAAWGRVFFVYGPHEHPDRLVASVVRSLQRGVPAHCSSGREARDFLYVEDVADAFVTVLDGDISGPFNIGSGTPVAIRDLVGRLATAQGRPDLIEWGAHPARPDEPPVLVADVRRLRDEVGWQPKWDLDTGLARTVEWWARQQ